MTVAPRLSIVVPSYKGARRLPVLLKALTRQRFKDFEVVVVIDGDVDGSAEVVESHRDQLPIRSVILPQNCGRAAAINAGFDVARGEVLVRCDDDLEPGPGYTAGHHEAHLAGPVGVIGLCRNAYPRSPYARVYGGRADAQLRTQALRAGPHLTWRYWGGNVSVRRETWTRIGPYDDATFPAYGWEDIDWGYRLYRAGIPVVISSAVEVVHHGAAVTVAARARRALYSGAAFARFRRKHRIELDDSAARRTAWNVSVSALAKRLDEKRLERISTVADRHLGWLPGPVATKAVALLVEAAFAAGSGRPDVISSGAHR